MRNRAGSRLVGAIMDDAKPTGPGGMAGVVGMARCVLHGLAF